MKGNIEIGTAKAAPGFKAFGELQVSLRPDGSWITVPVSIVNGSEEGPVLWLQAGSHGEEVCGTFCVNEVVNNLDPSKVRGAVVGIPVINTPSWMVSNFSTVGQRLTPTDYKNLNRVYPGDPKGSLSDQIAYVVFEEMKKWASVLVDCHDGGWSFTEAPLVIFHKTSDSKFNLKQREMARALLLEVVWITTQGGVEGSLAGKADACSKAAELGIPSFALELTGSYNFPEGYEYSVGGRVKGILNLMRFMGMLEGKVESIKQDVVVDPWFKGVKHGGMLHYKAELGQVVKKGEVIAEIRDVFYRNVVDTFVCPFEKGMIIVRRAHPTVNPGDWVVNIGSVVEDEEKLLNS